MPTQTVGGMASEYTVEVRKADGRLFYQESSVMFPTLPPMPAEPTCYTKECINAYKKKFDVWAAECKKLADFYKILCEYHKERCKYCMKHRDEIIDNKYRTGVPSPQTIDEAKREIEKLRRLM